jgi:hypothetical protein
MISRVLLAGFTVALALMIFPGWVFSCFAVQADCTHTSNTT